MAKDTTKATAAAAAIKRAQTHCKRGHPLSGDNLRICVRGYRHCKICAKDSTLRFRAIKRVALLAQPSHSQHGTPTGYSYGCRCRRCIYANSKYNARLRRRKQ